MLLKPRIVDEIKGGVQELGDRLKGDWSRDGQLSGDEMISKTKRVEMGHSSVNISPTASCKCTNVVGRLLSRPYVNEHCRVSISFP